MNNLENLGGWAIERSCYEFILSILPKDKNGKWIGDSTEVALVQFAFDKNLERTDLEKTFPRVAELPFDSTRKCMTTFHKTKKGIIAITKGAVEILLEKLPENQKSIQKRGDLEMPILFCRRCSQTNISQLTTH